MIQSLRQTQNSGVFHESFTSPAPGFAYKYLFFQYFSQPASHRIPDPLPDILPDLLQTLSQTLSQTSSPRPSQILSQTFSQTLSVPLPDSQLEKPYQSLKYLDYWQEPLIEKYDIEVPVITWPNHPKRVVRISAQLYNSLPQYKLLADALKGLCDEASRV